MIRPDVRVILIVFYEVQESGMGTRLKKFTSLRSRFAFTATALFAVLLGTLPHFAASRVGALTPTLPPAGNLRVRIQNGGADSNQQSQFNYLVVNVGSSAVSNISVRVYIQLDGSQPISKYVMEKYWDQSGVGTISGPTLASGSTYYYTVSYGATALAAGASWQFNNFSAGNDWFHTGYAVGALPSSFTDTNYLPAYVNGAKVWGLEPGGTTNPTATNTGVPITPSRTNTSVATATRTNTPVATNTPTRTNTPGPTFQPPTNTPGGATATRTNTPAPTNTPTRTPIPTTAVPGTHLPNPFIGAQAYINPDWAASVNAEADIQGGTLGAKMRKVATYSTAVWLDTIDAVNGTGGYARSFGQHLDAAVAQGANLITIVVYNLPNRDCSALASNGELLIAQNGFNRYKTEYIDVIASVIASKPAYANLRIVAIIEPDSLPNLVTNLSFPKCQEALGAGGYREATQYTLNKLYPLRNVYSYVDIAHAGWLGWDGNFNSATTLISDTIKGTTAGVNSVDGFITNTANYSVVDEPYMDAGTMIGGSPARSADYFSWNTHIEETTYAAAWAAAMQAKGHPAANTNILVDTSRNGWGGCGGSQYVSQPCRPTGPSTATSVNLFVDQSRIDRRPAKGDWCNQNGAGLGAPPQVNPPGGVFQAYVWVKPPGESDGSSSLIPVGPENPGGKGFDRMCDPTYGGNQLNNNKPTNALPNAPVSGRWFQAQFVQLVQNAHPAIVP
jgi:cellulose 1,4-beta-cellobiosidase